MKRRCCKPRWTESRRKKLDVVYRSGHLYHSQQIVLYEYQRTRNTSHPREFLRGYDGICVTDGYQVYHPLDKELEELSIAGCRILCNGDFSLPYSLEFSLQLPAWQFVSFLAKYNVICYRKGFISVWGGF